MEKVKNDSKLKPTVTREYVPLLGDLFMSAYAETEHYQKMYGVDFYTRCGYFIDAFYYGDEAIGFGDVLINKEKQERDYLKNLFKYIYDFGEELLVFSKNIGEKEYLDDNLENLLKIFKEFTKKYKFFAISLMGFNLQFPVEKKLREVLKNSKNIDDDLGILTFPRKENIAACEQTNLLKIGTEIEDLNIKDFANLTETIKEKISDHVKEYGWINTRGGIADPWTAKEIFQRILDLGNNYKAKLRKQNKLRKEIQEESEELIDKLGPTEELRSWVGLAKELVYFRTYRTDYLNWIFSNLRPLLKAIARFKNLSYQEILYLDVNEILGNKEFSRDEIKRRMKNYSLLTVEPNKLIFTSDPEKLKKIKEKYIEEIKEKDVTEFRGNIGFKGVAKGLVKIVIVKKDMVKVNKGDILVSPMTTPDFVPAMEKAAAFVTNEGGITCHAAIVAREMKRPCIIGTKIATKVLKDGMQVEVDAEEGVVKIIEQ